MVANAAIVRHMAVSHQQAVVADSRLQSPALRAAVDGYKFADFITAADLRESAFAPVLKILRRYSDRRIRKEDIIFAYDRRALDKEVRHEPRARANFNVGAKDTERAYVGSGIYARGRVDDSCRVDRH